MPNTFIVLTAPAANGSGPAVDVSDMGASKTIIIAGAWAINPPTVNLEVNNAEESDEGGWLVIESVQGAGKKVLDVAARWMRVTVSNYRGGDAPVVGLGGPDTGVDFVELGATAGDGIGATVSVSTLGALKTFHVAGSFSGTTTLEISLDGGTTWAGAASFTLPGIRTQILTAGHMRVRRSGVPALNPGLPIVHIGACDITASVGGGGTASFNVINVMDAPYNAVGDGDSDDTEAISAAIHDAIDQRLPVWFPRPSVAYKMTMEGSAGDKPYHVHVPASDDLKLFGDNATITYESEAAYGFLFTATSNRVTIEGLRFVGSGDMDMEVNFKASLYFSASCPDVEVRNCHFVGCTAVSFGSDGMFPGRFHFTGNRCINGNGAISGNAYSVITDNWFLNDENYGSGSHYIYLYGPSVGCIISNNVFRNNSQNAIQIRAGQARFQQKHGFIITNNTFIGNTVGVYCGSDDTTEVGGVIISNNYFKDNGAAVTMQGLRDSLCAGNQVTYTWENIFNSVMAAAVSLSAAPGSNGHWCNTVSCKIVDNNITVRHPYYAVVTVNTIPTAGQTLTVGGVVYSWSATALAPNQLEIQSSIAECADEIVYVLQGNRFTRQNPVLRDMHDAFNTNFPYDGAPTNQAIIVSGSTFALSTTADGSSITATSRSYAPDYAIKLESAIWPAIQGNTCTDFGNGFGIVLSKCIAPSVIDNTCIGTTMFGDVNIFSTYRNNKFVLSPGAGPATLGDKRWLILTDGFTVVDNDRLAVAQEGCIPELMGATCLQPVGDGRAFTWLWYGQELFDPLDPSDPNSLPFRWDDGDEVYLDDGSSNARSFTFKRSSPGAGQFSTADELISLINTEGTYTAAYAPYNNVGGTTNPKALIRITHAAGGAAGNSHRLYCTRTNVRDNPYYRTCGVVLVNRYAAEIFTRFLGGSASLTRTAFFSPITSDMVGVRVQGVDADSHALGPVVYLADLVPGVGGTISHSAAVGTEGGFHLQVTR